MKSDMNGIRSKIKRSGRRAVSVLMALILFVGAFNGIVFFTLPERAALAAEGDGSQVSIQTYDGETLTKTKAYDMRVGEMSLELKYGEEVHYESETDFIVEWNIETGADFIDLLPGSSQVFRKAVAKKPGEATITVTVYQKNSDGTQGGRLTYAEGRIKVWFAIDSTWNNDIFKYAYDGDVQRSLVMYVGDSPRAMRLNFGAASDAQWQTENDEVASVGLNTGIVTAVGAGFTKLKATYTPVGGDYTATAELDVYVVPKARGEGQEYSTGPDIKMNSGDSFYVDAVFKNNTEVIRSKIYWSVKVEDGSGARVEIANSKQPGGKTSELISLTPASSTSNRIQVTGTAGEYFVYLYVYNPAHKDNIPARETGSETDAIGYSATVVKITITSAILDKDVTLGIGDVLDLAQSYNMTREKFLDTFSVQLRSKPDGEGATVDSYASYNSSLATVTALRENVIYATMTIKSGKESYVKSLLGLNAEDPFEESNKPPFNTKITIVDGITLAPSSVVIMVGQEYQLTASLHGTYTGAIRWKSADSSFVSVDENSGRIKGLKVTTSDIRVSASVNVSGGVTRTASTMVKVETAMTDFTLNPDGDKFMNVGDVLTIEAKIKETVSVAPLRWISSKEDVFTVTPAENGKTAVINAVAGGTGTLMVENTLNGKRVQIDITVRIPITEIKFSADTYSYPFYQNGHNMREELSISPADATSTTLIWSVDNTSVATVDSSGYLRFVAPGTVSLMVRPEHNPNNLYANCIVKVTGGPDNITFSNLKDDHLDIEVSETKTVELKFEPTTAETSLIWKTNLAGIVLVDYDSDKRQLKVVGRKVGEVTVSCRTEDNVYYSFTVTVTQASTGVSFTKDSITLYRGDVLRGTANLMDYVKMIPETSTDTLTFSSRNDKVASVNATTGVVTAVAAGTTYIMVTTSSGRSNSIDVIVIDRVTEIQSSFRTAIVYIGETLTISPTVVPATATNKTIKWYWEPYEAGGTASVNLEEKGTDVDVTGVSKGMVMLTGVSDDNSAVSVTYVLNVKYRNPQYTTVVTLTPKTKYVNVGKTFKVTRKVTGAYKGNKTLKWKSSNKKVATVTSAGKVKAKKVGKATITATAQDGSKAKGKMKVVVRRLVTKIKMNKSSVNLLVGKSTRLSVKVTPSNATVKGVTWKSGDRSIATVDGGKVIAVAPGMVKITATSKDAKKKKTYCWVTVSEPVPITGFDIPNASLTVAKGDAVQSGIVPNPSNATDSIKFWSDNKAVATVSSRGKIKTHRVGKATIYARAANGVEGHVDVTVVDLNRKAVTLRQYDSEQLSVVMINTGVTWYSRDPSIASVDATGLVKGRLPGTTVVYAKVNGVTLGCRVTVKKIK